MTESNKPTSVSLAMADFPGWKAYLDGMEVAHQTSGRWLNWRRTARRKHFLSLKFAATPLRRVANGISFLAVCILVGTLYNSMKNQMKNNQIDVTELDTIKKKSVSGAFSYILRTALLQGVGFLSLAILSSVFAPEDFGIYGFVVMIIGLLTFFSDVGLAAALVQRNKNQLDRVSDRIYYTNATWLGHCCHRWEFLVLSGIVAQKTGWKAIGFYWFWQCLSRLPPSRQFPLSCWSGDLNSQN